MAVSELSPKPPIDHEVNLVDSNFLKNQTEKGLSESADHGIRISVKFMFIHKQCILQ